MPAATLRPGPASGRSRSLRASLLVVAAVVVVLGGALALSVATRDTGGAATAGLSGAAGPAGSVAAAELVLRPDSHRLPTPGADSTDGTAGTDAEVVLVQFFDVECEACRAVHPFVEQLRQEYAGRVTFAVRYFPLPGHANSRTGAHAVEAAAQQGRFEDMYQRMYATQAQWGEQRASQAHVFRGFAEDLGLDMTAYDAAVASPETAARVQADVDDGTALGVTGTPTFFLDGRRIEPATTGEFRGLLDAALARTA